MEIRVAQTNTPPTVARPDAIISPISMAPVASIAEGKLDRSEKIYIESSAHYFPSAELDDRPAVLAPPDLGAISIGPTAEGKAALFFFLNENGRVDRIEIEDSTLPETMMEQLQARRNELQFTPGRKNGINVKSVIHYEIVLARDPTITTIYSPENPSKQQEK